MIKIEFTAEAAKPNMAAPSSYDSNPEIGITWHEKLEEKLVQPFSHLRMQMGWTLKGESHCDGMGGYGTVEAWNWQELMQAEPLEVIIGDGSPLSYMQAAMLYRNIDEFGRFWHSTSWGMEEVLDSHLASEKGLVDDEEHGLDEENWTFLGKRPVKWNPTYAENEGIVKISYYSFNPIDIERIYHNVHTFNKGSYTQKLRTREVARGLRGGIIF